ncbi:MAG TPA: MATE family efflux transporter [Rhizomicrobium sp.]|jgi:MATE family multidrug resistance protein|nr:MATE family efflux transporter [Rhizomicrobium sp.]
MADVLEFDTANAGERVEGSGLDAWLKEARELLKLAGPLVITQLAQMVVMTTDIVMLSRYSETALAGAGLGNTVFFLCWLIGTGPAAAVSPMVAHILGAHPKDRANVRGVVRMGLWSVVVLWLPLAILLLSTEPLLKALGQKPELAHAASLFVFPLCFGLPFSLGFQVLRNYATALNRPNTSLIVMGLTVFFNAVGDYALIFGHFGAPRLGLVGSGIASACSYGFSFLAMVAVIYLTPELKKYRMFRRFHRPDWGKLAELYKLGIPIGLTMIFEAMLFNASMLIMGTFGTEYVAAHQIALNVPSITFMVPLGIALAATVRVGLSAGAGDRVGVRRAGYTAMIIGTGFMAVCAVVLAVFPRTIAELYFAPTPSNGHVISLVVSFLYLAAAFQVFDGLQVVGALSLRGLKDARAPMWIAGACYWLAGFPVCYLLSVTFGMKGLGIWIGLAFALLVAAAAMCGRFYYLARDR